MAETLLLKSADEVLIQPVEKRNRGPQIKLNHGKKNGGFKG